MKYAVSMVLLLICSCQNNPDENIYGPVDMRLLTGSWRLISKGVTPEIVDLVEITPGWPEITSPNGDTTNTTWTGFTCWPNKPDTCFHDVRLPGGNYEVRMDTLINAGIIANCSVPGCRITKLTSTDLFVLNIEMNKYDHYRRETGKILVDTTASGARKVRYP